MDSAGYYGDCNMYSAVIGQPLQPACMVLTAVPYIPSYPPAGNNVFFRTGWGGVIFNKFPGGVVPKYHVFPGWAVLPEDIFPGGDLLSRTLQNKINKKRKHGIWR